MVRMNPALFTPLKNGVNCNQCSVLKDADLIGKGMDFQQSASGGIRNTVSVTADADHAFSRHPAFQLQNRFEWCQR